MSSIFKSKFSAALYNEKNWCCSYFFYKLRTINAAKVIDEARCPNWNLYQHYVFRDVSTSVPRKTEILLYTIRCAPPPASKYRVDMPDVDVLGHQSG